MVAMGMVIRVREVGGVAGDNHGSHGCIYKWSYSTDRPFVHLFNYFAGLMLLAYLAGLSHCPYYQRPYIT